MDSCVGMDDRRRAFRGGRDRPGRRRVLRGQPGHGYSHCKHLLRSAADLGSLRVVAIEPVLDDPRGERAVYGAFGSAAPALIGGTWVEGTELASYNWQYSKTRVAAGKPRQMYTPPPAVQK